MAREAQASKPEITIFLRTGSSTTYSTHDKVEGTVSITAWHATDFADLSLQLCGTASTMVQSNSQATTTGQAQANHCFLKLEQAIAADAYPSPRVLKADKTYDFDFEFFIPEQIEPTSCKLPVSEESVWPSHSQLPPTLGNRHRKGMTISASDDVSPAMLCISYEVVARVWGKEEQIARASQIIRVIPASRVQTPICTESNEEHKLYDEMILRKGPFKTKLGTFSVTAESPGYIPYLDMEQRKNSRTTSVAVVLQFDPSDRGVAHPKLGTVKARLLVTNYFSSKPRQCIPTPRNTLCHVGKGMYVERLKLPPIAFKQVIWQRASDKAPDTPVGDKKRSDSVVSMMSFKSRRSSEIQETGPYHSRLEVLITMPNDKILVPTFHSCLISRTYTLQLFLEVEGNGKMELRMPIEIRQE